MNATAPRRAARAVDTRLEMRGDPEELRRARAWVTEVAGAFGLPGRDAYALKTAVSEALANIMRHAYAGLQGMPILLNCCWRGGRLVLAIRDYGRKAGAAFLRPRAERPPESGGLGVWMMHALVDQVSLDLSPEEGSILTLVKSGGRRP